MNLLRTTLLFWLSFSLCLFAADRTGPELLQHEMPAYYRAWVETVGTELTNQYFADWTPEDLNFLRQKMASVEAELDDSQPFVRTAENLYHSWGSHLFGISGEVVGNLMMRRIATAHPGSFYVDEIGYDQNNTHGKRPDGLIVEARGKDLVIHQIMESKLGMASWNAEQIEGFLNTWRSRGIHIPLADGSIVYFPPARIRFSAKTGEKPIQQVTVADVKARSLLVTTRPNPDFTGTVHQLPVEAGMIREVALHYFTLRRGHRSAPPGSRDTPMRELEPLQVEHFQEALRDYIFEKGHFPRSSEGHLGKLLAKLIQQRGGQSNVTATELDGATRHYLTILNSVPAKSPLLQKVLNLNPEDPSAISVLRLYIRSYEHREKNSPLEVVQLLEKKSPEWKTFFAQHSPYDLQHADINEVDECLTRLVQLSRAAKNKAKPPVGD